jgi:hypothetical protein
MFVATKLAKIKAASLFVASPSAYARAAVAAIGYEVSHLISLYCFSSLVLIIFLYIFLHFTFQVTSPQFTSH